MAVKRYRPASWLIPSTTDFREGQTLVSARWIDIASTFRLLDDAALEAYLECDRPYDCAGSVNAEALGIALFTRIGSYDPTVASRRSD